MKQFTISNQLTAMPKRLAMVLTMLLIVGIGQAWGAEPTATLSFANKAQRTSFSTTKQVWEQNGVTFTNDKANSSNAVADYAAPVRLYAGSSVTVACSLGNMKKIVFDCNSNSYATAMKNSIGNAATASSDKVTVTLDEPSKTFSVAKLTAQVRLDAITVTYEVAVTEYNITYTGDEHITYSGTKPETIKKEESGFELEFSVDDGYKLNNVQVKMGGQNLVVDDDYYWEEGYLLILPGTDITGDIEIIFETVATCTNPTITTQPTGATYTKGATATALKVVASGDDLTYQWYSNTSNSTSGATKINGATNFTYTPSISTVGTKYYYCIVSSGSCATTSNIVSVVVKNPPFTVTLVPGSGSVTNTELEEPNAGAGVDLPTPTICDGWTFAGWATSAVTTETTTKPTLIAAGTYKPTSNITLYAVYQRTETTEGGGSVTPQTDEVTISDFGTGTSTRTYSATYADWTWAKNSGSNIATYDEIRLYASHSMKISPKSGYTISSIVATCTSNSYANALAGNKLEGANKSVSGSTVTITPTSGDIVITQSAQSRVSEFTVTYSTTAGGTTTTTYYYSNPDCATQTALSVTYNGNGNTSGSVPTDATEYKKDDQVTVLGNTGNLAKTGYTFSGWNTEANGTGTTYAADDKFTITENTTLYAKWTANTYTITFNAGTGECGTESVTTTNASGVTLPTASHTCTDWTFAGWWTEEVSSTNTSPGTLLKAGDNYNPTSNITLYAVYSAEEVGDAFTGYAKVTENLDDWSGKYLLSTGTYTAIGAFTSGHLDRTTYTPSTEEKAEWEFTLEKVDNTYSILFPDGNWYLGWKESTSFERSTTDPSQNVAYLWTPSISGISNVSATTRKIADNGSADFRPYSSPSSSSIVYLYKRIGGGSTTTYNSNPTCLVPVWEEATIDKTALTVNCGERSPMTGANGAAIISFPTEKIYNFTKDITIEATTGFLVSTSQTEDANYKSLVSLSPLVGTANANTFYDKHVYVRAEAPAQSDTDLEGTITIKNSKGETLQTFSVTADVTCNKCTVQFVDRGANYQEPILLYAGQTIDEAPTDPEGVCTDPIHYVFDGWAKEEVSSDATSYSQVSFPYKVTGNTKFYAVYRYTGDGGEPSNDFVKVTSAKDDWTGDYVIVNEDAEKAIGNAYKENTSSNKTLAAVAVTITDNKVVSPSENIIWQIRKNGENYTMYNAAAEQYAYVTAADARKAGLSNSPQDMNISWGSDATKTRVYSPDYARCFSYYSSNSEWRTYATSTYSTGTLYCRSLETYLYTTSPVCGPHLEITAGKEIYVTGGNAGAARDLVMASQKVSYQATRLKTQDGSPEGTAPDVKVATNGITKGGVVTTEVKVTFENIVKELQPDDTYTITGDIVVTYEADANNMQEDIQVQLAVDYPANADARDNFIVHARSLPSEFVIVAKSGDKWYALNADMSSSKAQPANGQVTLNDLNNPIEATYAPCNAIYTFEAMPQGAEDRKSVRFIGMENKYLWAASEGNNGVQNYSKAPAADALAYNWKLYTEDNITYHFGNAQNTRMLGLHSTNVAFGMYANGASVVQDIRILPYVEKCIYNYAPTNLTVTDLKGTHVTLTWDGVVGATKYQYSDDATNWTDCGTEPTVTITGLGVGTTYIYYIRAYHEDAGVSNECIDYEEITFTTADCDDVPTNISYSADLSTITVTWTASSATSTVKLYSDKEGTTVLQTTEGTNSVTFEGLIKNTQYYVQVFGGGSCASAIIPAKTKDVEMDIVEWDPQGIIVDVNTNEKIGVTLENEVAFGTGVGKKAEDIFFSKYFEANGTAKILAIYNGTDEKIDLSTVSILNDLSGQSLDLAEFGHKEVGYIYPNEEIILFNKGVEAVTECSEQQDSYPDWYNVEHSVLNFSGRATLILKRGDAVIDIIGSIETKGTNYPNDLVGTTIYNIAKSPTGENEKPSWGDDPGWVCESGDNIMTDVEETDYPLSTNRCLLVRKNTVVSGVNAVTNNIDKVFATLCDEWVGLQIPQKAPSTDNGVTESCEGMAFVGDFDYSSYYTKYVPIGGETTFEENQRNLDGTLTVPITDLYKQACRNIKVTLKDEHNKVIMTREYKVPIMITTDQATAYTEANKGDNAFYALQDNLATIEVDENGDEIARYPLTIAQVREICKTCDVVIRDKATLTKAADDDTNDHPQVNNVMIYEGASLEIPSGADYNYTINSLSLRRKGDTVASAKVEEGGKLHLPASATAPIYLDMRIDANNWHWFTLPYACDIADVTWVDGTPAQYNKDWFIMYYDGNSRANEQSIYENHWKVYNGTTIEAGKGYIVGIQGDITHPNHTFELRFPMATEVLTKENGDKKVPVNAWGVKDDITPNKKGWNLVGNPYLDYYQPSTSGFKGLPLIKYTNMDPVTGEWHYDNSGNVPFIVTPVDGGWYEYKQELASEVEMMPFTAYFVQVGDPEIHENGAALNAEFIPAKRGRASLIQRAANEVDEIEESAIVRVTLTNAKGESDKTSLIIDDQYTDEYEMNADFFKWFGDYYKYYTKPVLYTIGADQGKRAFNAISEDLATQPISLGMYAAQAGNYTFSLDLRSDLSKVQEVWLYDATQDTYTNLLQDSYTFQTAKTESAGRFFLSVKMAPKVSTNIDNIADGTIWATTQDHTIFVNGLLSNAQLWIYDATGKLLHTDQTQYYQHSYSVPISGTYFVRVQNTMQTQTIKVVVE